MLALTKLQRVPLLFSAALLLLGLSACASNATKQDYDINYDFSQLKSFSLMSPESSDPLTASRIADAINQGLTAQGFANQDKADFNVNFAFDTQDKPKSSGLSIGLGTGKWGSSGGASIGTSVGVPLGSDTAQIQTIQIDIIDANTNKLIWRGSDQFEFDAGGQDKAEKTVNTVKKILAQFPPKAEK